MTLEELEQRVAELEAKTQDIHRTTFRDEAAGLTIPCLMVSARVGIFTNFWMHKPIGQGAALSIGTNIDRYALYAEIDEQTCPDAPSVGVYGSVCPSPTHPQAFIGVLGNASNSPSTNYGGMFTSSDKTVGFRAEGLELVGTNWFAFLIGKVNGAMQRLWP